MSHFEKILISRQNGVKQAIFDNFGDSKLWVWGIHARKIGNILPKIQFQSLQIVKINTFEAQILQLFKFFGLALFGH